MWSSPRDHVLGTMSSTCDVANKCHLLPVLLWWGDHLFTASSSAKLCICGSWNYCVPFIVFLQAAAKFYISEEKHECLAYVNVWVSTMFQKENHRKGNVASIKYIMSISSTLSKGFNLVILEGVAITNIHTKCSRHVHQLNYAIFNFFYTDTGFRGGETL